MTANDRLSPRWVGFALGAAVMLGACGGGTAEEAAPTDDLEAPAELALDDAAEPEAAEAETQETESEFIVEEFGTLEDLENYELTPEIFEELKANEVSRAAVLEEMASQGLDAEEAECFLDTVSPGLFITFGAGEQPNDEQFTELLQLLDTCEIAFGAES